MTRKDERPNKAKAQQIAQFIQANDWRGALAALGFATSNDNLDIDSPIDDGLLRRFSDLTNYTELDRTTRLADELAYLARTDNATYEAALSAASGQVVPICNAIYKDNEQIHVSKLIPVDKLAPLQRHLPIIAITRAAGAVYLLRMGNKKHRPEMIPNDYLRTRREVDMYSIAQKKENIDSLRDAREITALLVDVLSNLPHTHPHSQQAASLIAEAHYLDGAIGTALNWVVELHKRQGDIHADVPSLIMRDALLMTSDKLSHMIKGRNFEQAESLITQLEGLPSWVSLDLHRANLAFAREDYTIAIQYYTRIWEQEADKSDSTSSHSGTEPPTWVNTEGLIEKQPAKSEPKAENSGAKKSPLQILEEILEANKQELNAKNAAPNLEKPPTYYLGVQIPLMYMADTIAETILTLTEDIQPTRDSAAWHGEPLSLPNEIFQIAPDNAWQAAMSGMAICHMRLGNAADAEQLILRVLDTIEDGKSNESIDRSALFKMLENINKKIRSQSLVRKHALRKEAYEAGDYAAAQQHALQMVTDSHGDRENEAWLGLILARQNGDVAAIKHLYARQTANSLAAIPTEELHYVLAYLREASMWHLVEKLVSLVALPDEWLADHHARLSDYIDTEKAAIEAHMAANQQATARQRVIALRKLAPNNPDILMLHAITEAAQLNNGMARIILRQVIAHHPAQAEEAAAMLEILSDGDAVDISHSHHPYIHLYHTGGSVVTDTLIYDKNAATWHAMFAVRLHSVYLANALPSIHYQTAEMLLGLHRGELYLAQPHFSWRIIAQEGRLTVALMCRVSSFDQHIAQQEAQRLWETISEMLPLQREKIYYFEPVKEANALEHLREPFPIQHAVALVRREHSTKSEDYRVEELSVGDSNLHRSLQLLLGQPNGAMLDVFFQPTEIFAWERDKIAPDVVKQEHEKREGTPEKPDSGNVFMDFNETMQREAVLNQQQQLLNRLQALPYLVQIRLSSLNDMPSALPEWVGLDLFGLAQFDVLKPANQHEMDVFRRNVSEVSGERFGFTAAPEHMERLRYLFTPLEAITATRLPTPGNEGLPGMTLHKVRLEPLPNPLPEQGVIIGESLMPIRGRFQTVRIDDIDRTRHVYIVGRTGTGKSMLIQNMALQDIEAGRGVGVIDPHGDLVEGILERIPPHRYGDVVYFDPSDEVKPIGLNIMDIEGVYEQSIVISDFIALMYSIFDPNRLGIVGPRFENAVRNAMMMAMEIEGTTFVEVVRILTDDKYRKACIDQIKDPIVKNYWEEIAANFRRFGEGEMIDYVTSKFGRFVNDPLMRNIIGQGKNRLNFDELMQNDKIILVNLSKGRMGSENSHFLGLILVPQLFVAALNRAKLPESERKLFSLYVDEFHNFTTPTFSTILSEARKYGVALTIANQFISQVDQNIRESVFGNVGTILSFRLGIRDAQFIAPEFFPVFSERDVINLPNYHLLAKMLVSGDTAPAFPIRTRIDERPKNLQTSERLREASRYQYGRDIRLIKQEIDNRFHHPPKSRKDQ